MPDIETIRPTPEALAGLCGCSPRHFNRLFREHFGESPRARQTELRLLKARQLLGDADAKIIQVALDSGYHSLSLFNALFKRRFGMSPSAWRQKTARAGGTLGCLLALLFGSLAWSAIAAPAAPASSGAGADFVPLPLAQPSSAEAERKAQEALRHAVREREAQE